MTDNTENLILEHLRALRASVALRAIATRMRRYRGTPMNFADASLLWLADRIGTRCVLTIDEREFGAFRLAGGKRPLLELRGTANVV